MNKQKKNEKGQCSAFGTAGLFTMAGEQLGYVMSCFASWLEASCGYRMVSVVVDLYEWVWTQVEIA